MTFFMPFSQGLVCIPGKEEDIWGRLMKVSRTEPCPICGKPDYCFWKEREKDPDMFNLYCNRTSEAIGNILTGKDGKEYIAVYQNTRGTVFESVEQRTQRKNCVVEGTRTERTSVKNHCVIDSVTPLSNDKLDTIYRCMMKHLPLYQYHAQYLLSEGWDMELILNNGICSFPVENKRKLPSSLKKIPSREALAKKVMQELGIKSLAGVPGAYINDKGNWSFVSKSGIVFPVYDEEGFIYRIRIRLDYLDLPVLLKEDSDGFFYEDEGERVSVTMSGPIKKTAEETIKIRFSSHEGKYRNFSSYLQNEDAYKCGFIENVFNKGCEAKNQLLFAMHPDDDYETFWIIEGEKKAIFSNHILKQPFIGLSGVNDFGRLQKNRNGKTALEIMKNKGARRCIIAYDADRYHNAAVMMFMNNLADMLISEELEVYIADWNEENGKGLDDLLSSGHLPFIYNYKISGTKIK